jgi:Leucine-rich repeat (LRR) protein
MVNLQILFLMGNGFSDISALSGLQALTDLYMAGNQIVDISPLSNMLQLSSAYLYSNFISDISALVANSKAGGLGAGDVVYLNDNPLDGDNVQENIDFLRSQGVLVYANVYGTNSLY